MSKELSREELKRRLIEFGALDDNGGLQHCHRCECEMTAEDNVNWGDDLMQLIDTYTAQREQAAELRGRLIQAEASFDKWKWYKEQNKQLDFDVFLSGQVDSHSFELRQATNPEKG